MNDDNEKDKTQKTRFWDAALLISISTGILYILGYTYWVSFFNYFGIDEGFISYDFDQILAMTWMLALFEGSFILFFIGDSLNFKKINDASISIEHIGLAIFASIEAYLLLHGYLWALFSLFLIYSIISTILMRKYKKLHCKRIKLHQILKNRTVTICFGLIVLMILVLGYSIQGQNKAEHLANGQTGTRIILETNGGWQSPKDSVLIAHMNSKYFIHDLSNDNKNTEVFIIEDAQVKKVILLTNRSTTNENISENLQYILNIFNNISQGVWLK